MPITVFFKKNAVWALIIKSICLWKSLKHPPKTLTISPTP